MSAVVVCVGLQEEGVCVCGGGLTILYRLLDDHANLVHDERVLGAKQEKQTPSFEVGCVSSIPSDMEA